ncbi:unnamed protein product, partial [Mesorhabditis belari]|uniref:GB1/RHD3-type G domain-containing protein n=1 Tax=Mesorhabditis belari TaxID=2138241 RepID=A0AAF3JA24_9BILA
MYFVHKFHTECALYMLEHHGIEVDVRRYENEIIRRTENPNWTDAQKLKRKVLQRRKSNMSYEVPDRLQDHKGYRPVNSSEENVLLPLVTFEEDEIHFDEQIARKTFANEAYHGKKISLVTVMGPSRMGKSFLMSFLTGGMKGNKISGAFQSGYERYTEGILIFVNPMISKDGTHVIFFLDTQGTFDLKTTRNISTWIAGFSLLISDVQIVNLRGNISGDDLHDLNLFVESAASFKEGSVAKSLIFVIRDAADWKESEFLEKLWNQNEKSKEIKEIAASLKNRFINGIDCVCVAPVSDRIRRADRTIELQEEDQILIQCLKRVQHLIYEKCQLESKAQLQAPIELTKKITAYLQDEAPELRPTVELIQEATVIQAVNKAFDVFAKAIKTSTPETLSMAEALGKAEVHRKLETLLLKKENLVAEAHALLDPKIEEMLLEKKNEFASLKTEKDALKGSEKFAQEFKTKIHKISTLKEALHWERDSIIEKYGSFTMPSATIHSIKETLNTKIITLRSQFIETRLNELNNELRVYLLTTNFGNVPEEDQIKVHIKKMIESFKIECMKNTIESAQFHTIKEVIQSTLKKTGLVCRDMLVSKKIAEIKKAELEAELAAEIQVNVRRYENELIRRTENPKWTDAQKLKRKVLQRRQTKPTKKKICAQRVGDVFNELLAEEFHNVLACDPLSIAKISALIECSKSQRDFFSSTLCKCSSTNGSFSFTACQKMASARGTR